MICRWLVVGGLEHFLFSIIYGNVIIPTDFHIFRKVETTNQKTHPDKSHLTPNICQIFPNIPKLRILLSQTCFFYHVD